MARNNSIAMCGWVPTPAEPKLNSPGFAFTPGDEILQRAERQLGRCHQHARRRDELADRREVAQDVELHVGIGRGQDGDRGGRDQQRVAVVRRARHLLGADHLSGAGPVLDHELLAHGLRQPLGQDARADVGAAAGLGRNDDAHRPRRIVGLRVRRGDGADQQQDGHECAHAEFLGRTDNGTLPKFQHGDKQVSMAPTVTKRPEFATLGPSSRSAQEEAGMK